MTEPEGVGPGDAQPKGEPGDRPELDIDTAFAAIVADFSTPTAPGTGSWPDIEDIPDDRPDAGPGRAPDAESPEDDHPAAPDTATADGEAPDVEAPAGAGPRAEAPTETGRADPIRRRIVLPSEENSAGALDRGADRSDRAPGGADPRAPRDGESEDEEGYVPPEPPPLPRGDLITRLAWGAVIGGPLFLLVAALTWRTLPSLLLLLALLAFVGGFVTLVARMPHDPPDDPDDGAVV